MSDTAVLLGSSAVWGIAFGAFLMGLPLLGGTAAFLATTSIATAGLAMAYGTPILLRLICRQQIEAGPYNLGRWMHNALLVNQSINQSINALVSAYLACLMAWTCLCVCLCFYHTNTNDSECALHLLLCSVASLQCGMLDLLTSLQPCMLCISSVTVVSCLRSESTGPCSNHTGVEVKSHQADIANKCNTTLVKHH